MEILSTTACPLRQLPATKTLRDFVSIATAAFCNGNSVDVIFDSFCSK